MNKLNSETNINWPDSPTITPTPTAIDTFSSASSFNPFKMKKRFIPEAPTVPSPTNEAPIVGLSRPD
jgi:hypothetical protein